jgi:hypothetical protein
VQINCASRFFIAMTKLSIKQKLFCQFYVETLGNGTEAVIKAGYVLTKGGEVNRNLAKSIASENLTKPDIQKYIDELLEASGFNDDLVKLQHLNLISQSENLSVKAKAIDMYYKLSGKYSPTKVEETNPGLEAALERINKLLPDSDL